MKDKVQEMYDEYANSYEGSATLHILEWLADRIKRYQVPPESDVNEIEFRQMFAKEFLRMLIGCDEEGKPKVM